MHVFFIVVYICVVAGDLNIKRRRSGISLTGLIPPYCCAVPKTGRGFLTPYVVVLFVFNNLRLRDTIDTLNTNK
jgi:hypothetical protein